MISCHTLPIRVTVGISLLLLAACATFRSVEPVDTGQVLHDARFPGADERTIESFEQVFALGDEARDYLDENINRIRNVDLRGDALVEEIVARTTRSLDYESGANTTASETFLYGKANCLSMSILTYAMAEHVGYDARFQEVDTPEYWERRNHFSLMARHVNLLIEPKVVAHANIFERGMQVDFLVQSDLMRFPRRVIPPTRVLAMFYNNKGVDALLANDHELAYAYLRAAVVQDPTLDMPVSNLGLLYLLNGEPSWAETNYREALRLDPGNGVSEEGLATALKAQGRHGEAETILALLERRRRDNPYYQYILGEEAYDDGELEQAVAHFRRSIDLKPDNDLPWFGLARTFSRLGDTERAREYLRKAEQHAWQDALKRRYREKAARLSDL